MTGDGQEADSKGDLWFRSDIYTQVCCEFSDSRTLAAREMASALCALPSSK